MTSNIAQLREAAAQTADVLRFIVMDCMDQELVPQLERVKLDLERALKRFKENKEQS